MHTGSPTCTATCRLRLLSASLSVIHFFYKIHHKNDRSSSYMIFFRALFNSHQSHIFLSLLLLYRQSINILSSVQSPNLSFLGTPTLSRLSNSFITNSFRGKTPEIISNLVKPLLHPTTSDDLQQQQHEERKSSQYLLPSRKPSLQQIPEDQKPVPVAHEVSPYHKCSYTQAVVNGKHLQLISDVCDTCLAAYMSASPQAIFLPSQLSMIDRALNHRYH